MTTPEKTPEQAAADHVIERYFKLPSDPASLRRAAVQWLIGAVESAVLIPAIFYLRFGRVDELGWGTTVFFVGYCILSAVGFWFRPKTEYHTTVKLKGDWKDKVGAFWLVACVFGPFFAWIVTNAFPVTEHSWRLIYGLRVFLAAGLPLLTAIPLARYVRGKAALVSLPILVLVTVLPVSTAFHASEDLRDGPRDGVLVHTQRRLAP